MSVIFQLQYSALPLTPLRDKPQLHMLLHFRYPTISTAQLKPYHHTLQLLPILLQLAHLNGATPNCDFTSSPLRATGNSTRTFHSPRQHSTSQCTCKYLGVSLDTKLTFRDHLLSNKKLATSRVNAINIVNNTHHGCSSNIL